MSGFYAAGGTTACVTCLLQSFEMETILAAVRTGDAGVCAVCGEE